MIGDEPLYLALSAAIMAGELHAAYELIETAAGVCIVCFENKPLAHAIEYRLNITSESYRKRDICWSCWQTLPGNVSMVHPSGENGLFIVRRLVGRKVRRQAALAGADDLRAHAESLQVKERLRGIDRDRGYARQDSRITSAICRQRKR